MNGVDTTTTIFDRANLNRFVPGGTAKRRIGVLAVFLVCLFAVFSGAAFGVDVRNVANANGQVIFRVNFKSASDGAPWSMDEEQKAAILRAMQYWVDRVFSEGDFPATPAIININPSNIQNNASGGSTYVEDGDKFKTYLEAFRDGYRDPAGSGVINVGRFENGYYYNPNNQQISYRPDWSGINLETVMIHEMGHVLGITGPRITGADTTFSSLQWRDGSGDWYFRGTNATDVYGGDVPMDNNPRAQTRAHFGIRNGNMTHRYFRNYAGFMEVEMAALIDIGYDIELRNYFGKSIYTSDNASTIVVDSGYFATNGDGTYREGESNTTMYGLGLHVFGDKNTIVVRDRDILANGIGAAGIRSDGIETTLTVAAGTTVQANGDRGVGMLFAYGKNSTAAVRGTITATAADGDAVRFDIGKNMLATAGADSFDQELYSYYDKYGHVEQFLEHQDNLDGALVSSFDITGKIEGGRTALYMSRNTHVDTVNVMAGAEIIGDIISDYDSLGLLPDVENTVIAFGKQADGNGFATNTADTSFEFTIKDAILGNGAGTVDYTGMGKIDLKFIGGVTTAASGSNVDVNTIDISNAATFVLGDAVTVAGTATIQAGGILGYVPGDYSLTANEINLGVGSTLNIVNGGVGSYTVAVSKTDLTDNEFDTITLNGKTMESGDRYGYTWESTAREIKVALTAQNAEMAWKGGSGDWDFVADQWLDAKFGDGKFIAGDKAVFNMGEGDVNVAADVNPSQMVLNSGAEYVFGGNKVNIAASHNTNAGLLADGSLTLATGSKGIFQKGFSADSLSVTDATLGIGAKSEVVGNAVLTGMTLRYDLVADNTLEVGGTLNLSGTNTLDVNVFTFGKYTIATAAGGLVGKDTFDTITIDGASLNPARQTINWESTTTAIILELGGQNADLYWNGNDGDEWDGATANWLFNGSSDKFMTGDRVFFDGTAGEVAVSIPVKAGDLTVQGGANHIFTGEAILVNVDGSNAARRTGAVTVKDASKAYFRNELSAQSLSVTDASTFGMAKDVAIENDAELLDSTLHYQVAETPTMTVVGNLDITGSTLDFDRFVAGRYTIATVGGSITGAFDDITVAGGQKRERQSVTFENFDPQTIVAILKAGNVELLWNAGTGRWGGNAANWLDRQNMADAFIDGDRVVFDGSAGIITVSDAVSPYQMALRNGADHKFKGAHIDVGVAASTLTDGERGLLSITDGARGVFAGGVSSNRLVVDNGTFGFGADSTVRGGMTFANGSVLDVQASSAGHPLLTVDGTATIDGGSVNFSGVQRRGAKYTFLTANRLDVLDELALGVVSSGYTGTLGYDATSYWLQVTGPLASYVTRAETDVQRRVAEYFDTISPKVGLGDMNNVMAMIDDMTDAETRVALDHLYGNIYGSAATANFTHVSQINSVLSSEMRREFLGDACGGCEQCAVGDECGQVGTADPSSGRYRFWASALGYYGDADADGRGMKGYGQSMHGGVLGMDVVRRDDVRVGVFGSLGTGTIRIDALGEKSTTRNHTIGGYMTKEWDNLYALAVAGLEINTHRTRRSLAPFGRRAEADFNSYGGMGYLEGGATFAFPVGEVRPYAALQYAGVGQESVSESGAGALDLALDSEYASSLRTMLGVRGELNLIYSEAERFALAGGVSLTHEWLNSSRNGYTARMRGSPVGGASYRLLGHDSQRDWAAANVGVVYARDNWNFHAEYRVTANRRHTVHGWQVGGALSW